MHCLEKLLQAFEAFFALDSKQVIFMSLSCLKPPAGDQGGVIGHIFLMDESKACLLYKSLIDSGWYEEEQTNGAAEG